MSTDKPLWTQADLDEVMGRLNRITANAVARARVVMATIDDLRDRLDHRSDRQFRDEVQTYDDVPNAALLASYDAELARLCALPGVMNALYGDEVTP